MVRRTSLEISKGLLNGGSFLNLWRFQLPKKYGGGDYDFWGKLSGVYEEGNNKVDVGIKKAIQFLKSKRAVEMFMEEV